MISSISNSSQMQRPMHPPSQPLTNEQKETVNGILANYNSSNMSKADFESMKAEFAENDIKPSEDLKSIMEEAGFEVPERPGAKGINGQGKPKPPEFSKLIEQLGNNDISEEEIQSYIQNIQNEKGELSGAIMDEFV